jgi:hypothetical protein
MKIIRPLYDRLPLQTRNLMRKALPDHLLRWYAHTNTDVYLLSYPKCGRTWLRLLIGYAMACHFSLPQTEEILFLRNNKRWHPKAPRIQVIHEDRPMLKTAAQLQTNKAHFRNKKVIFLARDPRDVFVSSYFEMSKRRILLANESQAVQDQIFHGSLAEFINQPTGSFDTILAYYNIWAANRHVPKGFLLVRYEDMQQDTAGELRRVLEFIDLQAIAPEVIQQAIAYASFDNMRQMERSRQIQGALLQPGNPDDPDSYKTRKGKVRGFVDHLGPDEIAALNQKMQVSLSGYFGYMP